MTEVVAALLEQDGAYLVFQRPRNKARGGLFEFIGGKVEPGETHCEALTRECREELGAEVSVGDLFCDVIHEYPDITIHLFLYHARILSETWELKEHESMRAVYPRDLDGVPFCPADKPILSKLREVTSPEKN